LNSATTVDRQESIHSSRYQNRIPLRPFRIREDNCLRTVAGIVTPDGGRISLDERLYFDSASGLNLPIQQRRVGFVFQDYVLFPHLTAKQNVA